MTSEDTYGVIDRLKKQSQEIAAAGLPGWGNTMADAAETLQRYVTAMDAIYNHNEATRAAVIQHFGLWHLSYNA